MDRTPQEASHVTRQKVVAFQPQEWHGLSPTEGDRWLLIVETRPVDSELPKEEGQLLQDLGFPGLQTAEGFVVQGSKFWKAKFSGRREQEDERIKKQLYLLHAATGHCSMRHLIQALKRRKAAPRVLELAKLFVCPVCSERKRVEPRHMASLEPLPPTWHTITADIGHWQPHYPRACPVHDYH